MYRFPAPVGRETDKKEGLTAIPYALLTAQSSVQGEWKSTRIILPLVAAEESKFIKSAVEGLRGLPGCEGALLATAMDSSPAKGGGGGIRSPWMKVETAASIKYKSFVERFVFSDSADPFENEMDFMAAATDMDEAEELEVFHGQTRANQLYPPALTPTSSRNNPDEEGRQYKCFCSNQLPALPTFPMKTMSSTTLDHIAFVIMKRALYNTLTATKPFESTAQLLDSLGNSPAAQNQRLDFIVAASLLQI